MSVQSLEKLCSKNLADAIFRSINRSRRQLSQFGFDGNSLSSEKRKRNLVHEETIHNKRYKKDEDICSLVSSKSYKDASSSSDAGDTHSSSYFDPNEDDQVEYRIAQNSYLVMKRYLSSLPNKVWTEIFYDVIKESHKVTRDDSEESITRKECTKLYNLKCITDIFFCSKLITFEQPDKKSFEDDEFNSIFENLHKCRGLRSFTIKTVSLSINSNSFTYIITKSCISLRIK